MTYRSGIGAALAQALGVKESGPLMFCDGCGAIANGTTKRGCVAAWIMNRRPPPGWLSITDIKESNRDYCPNCKGAHQ